MMMMMMMMEELEICYLWPTLKYFFVTRIFKMLCVNSMLSREGITHLPLLREESKFIVKKIKVKGKIKMKKK
jgi:hypothetical protein